MALTDTERALVIIVADLRAALVRIMVETEDDHARAMARGADRYADNALRALADQRVRRFEGEPHDRRAPT